MANSWSFSKLGDFEKCKKYFWLKHEQKIPEPERALKPSKRNTPTTAVPASMTTASSTSEAITMPWPPRPINTSASSLT